MTMPLEKVSNIVPRVLEHRTHLFGAVNGVPFDLRGSGVGQPYDGLLNTLLHSTSGPVRFPMHLLSPIAIMGYPTFSHYQEGATDLFKISNGYEYTRELEFDCGGRMRTEHHISRTAEGLQGEFEVVEADVAAPAIAGIEPCIETFLPAGPGRIRSFFQVRWPTDDGDVYAARVQSEYRLRHDRTLPAPHFRLVQFSTDHSPERLKQDEVLVVVNNFDRLAGTLNQSAEAV